MKKDREGLQIGVDVLKEIFDKLNTLTTGFARLDERTENIEKRQAEEISRFYEHCTESGPIRRDVEINSSFRKECVDGKVLDQVRTNSGFRKVILAVLGAILVLNVCIATQNFNLLTKLKEQRVIATSER